MLGENAQLEGSVVAEDVMVRGRLIGSVRALRVTLQSKSHVEGNLFHKSLSIEQDTHFDRRLDALGALVTAFALQSPAGDCNNLAGNAGGDRGSKEDHGLGDIFPLGPTLQILRLHRGNVGCGVY